MSTKSILGKVLKAPLIVLMIASFAASIYAAYNKIQGITYTVPVILGVIIVLYAIGMFLDRKEEESQPQIN